MWRKRRRACASRWLQHGVNASITLYPSEHCWAPGALLDTYPHAPQCLQHFIEFLRFVQDLACPTHAANVYICHRLDAICHVQHTEHTAKLDLLRSVCVVVAVAPPTATIQSGSETIVWQ